MPAAERPLPEFMGRYRIESLIGRGGMGEVYKAYDPGLDRRVALKTISSLTQDSGFLDRLFREARACGRLDHPGVVRVYDVSEEFGFISMEFLEGESLAAAIDSGRLVFERKLTILAHILDALQYAHSQGVIHRDVKPSNVHLLPDGRVKLLDFGLARLSRADSLTMSGTVLGTACYMSPEQMKGLAVDERTDVYSAGVVAYELLTRRRPFDGERLTQVMLKVLSDDPPPMATAWSGRFPRIEQIVARALAKSPEQRFGSAQEMHNEVLRFLDSEHEAIVKASQEVAVEAHRQTSEAKTLINGGRLADSLMVLEATLRANPDAAEARALYEQARALSADVPRPAGNMVDRQRSHRDAAQAFNPQLPEPEGNAPTRLRPGPRPDTAAASTQIPAPPAGSSRRLPWWVMPAVAVALLSVVALFAQRDTAPAGDNEPQRSDADPQTVAGSRSTSPLEPVPDRALPEQRPSSPDLVDPAPNPIHVGRNEPPPNGGFPSRTQTAPTLSAADPGRVQAGGYIDGSATDPAVGAALSPALSAHGVTTADAQAVLRADVDGMTARLGGSPITSREAIADAQRIVAGYRSFGPLVRAFGPADYALNREVARRSLSWLARAGGLYATDPFAVRAFLDAYDVIGSFYRDYGGFYGPGAYVAYASAARLAQRLTYYGHDPIWFAQAMDRYALAYGTLAAHNGMLVPRWTMVKDLPAAADVTPNEPQPALAPLPLPKVDVSDLDAAQGQLWMDARDRFRAASSSVHSARVLLDQLSERLRRQGLTLNPSTAATALKMQGALEDASELLQAREFETAVESLRGAEAHRAKLRSAIGQ